MFKSDLELEKFFDELDLVQKDVKFKGGYYQEDEKLHLLTRGYRREWDDGVFIGNGMVGSMIYKESKQVTMWELSRNDVVAHNFLQGIDWAYPRVPIGNILLQVEDEIVEEEMRIKLWNAISTGKIVTKNGEFSYMSCVPKSNDGVYIKVFANKDVKIDIDIQPRHGISDRIFFSGKKPNLSLLPPMPYIRSEASVTYSVQEFINDDLVREGACVLAWQTKRNDDSIEFYVSIQNEMDKNTAINKAVADVNNFFANINEIENAHNEWWHNYYKQSFMCVNDMKWTKFYWMQMYKLACATREDGVVIDSQGPFMTDTPWPTTVWNLNVELSYSPVFTSNRLGLLNSLIRILKANKEALIDNATPLGINDGMYLSRATSPMNLACKWPDTMELGNIFWVLYLIDTKNRIIPDVELVKDLIYPYLVCSINTCRALMTEDEDGTLHIKDTSSPEYPLYGCNFYPTVDCNYTLSFLNWALKRVLELDEQYGFNNELKSEWIRMTEKLADYPVNENGYCVAKDEPFAVSHRHSSHLMMVYPLRLIDFKDKEESELALKSIDHWINLEGRLQGYSFTFASSMMSCFKNGNMALEYLNGLEQFLCSNTMYSEKGPVIETPISAAECVHLMLLQSQMGAVELFPAIPDAWTDACFEDFLAEGGFEVSANRENSVLVSAKIKSLVGNDLMISFKEDIGNYTTSHAAELVDSENNIYKISLNKGETFTMNVNGGK